MRLSEANKDKLYKAVSDPIMQMRIKNLRSCGGTNLDDELIRLEADIWSQVQKALKLDEQQH